MKCPKCDADVSESYEPDDHSVGIVGGWYCDACDLGIGEHEFPREPLEDDVPIPTAREVRGDPPLGTPLSEVSGRWVPLDHPDRYKYDEFCRIARSWGHE